MVDRDDVGLDSLHDVDSAGSLLTAEDLVVPGEIHVPRAGHCHPLHGQNVQLAEVAGNCLQLGGGGTEASRGGPGVAVMPADNSLDRESHDLQRRDLSLPETLAW